MPEKKPKNTLREALAVLPLTAHESGHGCDVSTTSAQPQQPFLAMTTLNSRLQLALLNRKKGRNLLEKGFTLVELMIVIVIVAVLSSVALPNFLKQTDKAKATEAKTALASILKQAQAGFIENGQNPSTTSGLATTAGTIQNLYGAPEAGVQKFDYTATVSGSAPNILYFVEADGNSTDSNLTGKEINGCINMATGVIKITTNLDDTTWPDGDAITTCA